jgi:hypothetical protein
MNRKEIREQMLELVAAWQNSHLSQSEFAKLHNIKLPKFRYWVLRSRKVPAGKSAFIQLQTPPVGNIYLRYPNGVELHLSSNTPASIIRELIKL